MQTCLVVTNKQSGSWHDANEAKIRGVLSQYEVVFADVDDDLPPMDTLGALAVCGGDGTLHNFVNRVKGVDLPLFYFPTGTLNERAKIGGEHPLIGTINDDYFVYVVAAGSFTPIGYTTKVATKKRIKLLAYLLQAVKEYKVHRIHATVLADERRFEDTYTLMMILKSPRCFLFRFNKMYEADKPTLHLLLIKAPPKDNLWGRIRIFAPLFRAFFVGFRHEKQSKNLVFCQCNRVQFDLTDSVDFNVDGERVPMCGTYRLQTEKPTPIVTVTPLPRKVPKQAASGVEKQQITVESR